MDTLNSIIQSLHQGWWMGSLDLKDACDLHVLTHLSHCRYPRFALRNAEGGGIIVYEWKVLPFHLATAPRVFTKLLAPVVAVHL